MSETKPNESSFPTEYNLRYNGLTKREYFAAMAMQGILSNPEAIRAIEQRQRDLLGLEISDKAVGFADALIAALNKETS